MKTLILNLGAAVLGVTILLLALHPVHGVLFQGPGVSLALGLLGLGLFLQARKPPAPAAAEHRQRL